MLCLCKLSCYMYELRHNLCKLNIGSSGEIVMCKLRKLIIGTIFEVLTGWRNEDIISRDEAGGE